MLKAYRALELLPSEACFLLRNPALVYHRIILVTIQAVRGKRKS